MTKKKILLATILSVSALCAVGTYFYLESIENRTASNGGEVREVNTVDYGEATKPQKDAGEATKEETTGTESGQNSEAQNATLTISRANQTNGVVSVRTVLENISSGTCTFTFSMAGQTSVVKTVEIVASPTYYTCKPLNVSPDEFSVGGNWKLSAIASNGTSKSNTPTAQVSVNK